MGQIGGFYSTVTITGLDSTVIIIGLDSTVILTGLVLQKSPINTKHLLHLLEGT